MNQLTSSVNSITKSKFRTKILKFPEDSPKSILTTDTSERNSLSVYSGRYKQFISRIKTEKSQCRNKSMELPELKSERQSLHIRLRKFGNIETEKIKSKRGYFFSFEKPIFEKSQELLKKIEEKNPNRKKTKPQIIMKHLHKVLKTNFEERQRLRVDAECLHNQFKKNFAHEICIYKYFAEKLRGRIGKLLFYIGMSLDHQMRIYLQNVGTMQDEIKLLHYQIYYSLKLGLNQILLEALKNCGQIYLTNNNYTFARHFFIKLLKLSLLKKSRFYEDLALENIGLCEYYTGNICQAQYFHNNIGKITDQSKIKICQEFIEEQYIQELYKQLFDNKGDKFILRIDENQKYLIVFENPRPIEGQYHGKKVKRAVDNILQMQKLRPLKRTAQIMRKKIYVNSQVGKVFKSRSKEKKLMNRQSQIIVSQKFNIPKNTTTTKLKMQIEIFLTVLSQLY